MGILISNMTSFQNELLTKLKGEVCGKAPYIFRGPCKNYMSGHIDKIYRIAHLFDLNSKEKCQKLGVC